MADDPVAPGALVVGRIDGPCEAAHGASLLIDALLYQAVGDQYRASY
jgi:hypothetical protein